MIARAVERIGRAAAWLNLGMVGVTCVVVVLRYAFGAGAIALQESVVYLHAAALSAGLAYTLLHDAHVRVDLVYARLGERGRARVNLAGHLLLLIPMCVCVIVIGTPYAASSWAILEASAEVGGIPAVFLLKSLLPFSALLLALQGGALALTEARALLSPRDPGDG